MNVAGAIPELDILLHASGFKIIDHIFAHEPVGQKVNFVVRDFFNNGINVRRGDAHITLSFHLGSRVDITDKCVIGKLFAKPGNIIRSYSIS